MMENIIAYNDKIAELEAAKEILDAAKPKILLSAKAFDLKLKSCFSKIQLLTEKDGTVNGRCETLSTVDNYTHKTDISDLRRFAACIIKLTGEITKEELDAVTLS